MFVIGLTGGIASGKTTVSDLFKDLNIDIVDADLVAREVVKPQSIGLQKIADHFGNHFLLANGELDRTKLRTEVFSNESSKQWLNNLLHPLIRNEITDQLKLASSAYCILVAPLLLENNLLHLVDRVLVVDVDETTQVKRAVSRDPSSEEEIKRIMASQISRDERLSKANDVICNSNKSVDELSKEVFKLNNEYLHLAKLKIS